MTDLLIFAEQFIPATLSVEAAIGLIFLSMLTSLLTSSLGAGGGILLLVAMSLCFPPAIMIPLHGVIQLGSNLGRASMARRHIHWPIVGWFLPGVIAGALLASLLLIQLPTSLWQILIASFVLYLCWGPPLPKRVLGKPGIVSVGAATTFLSPFVGASGPLVTAFTKQRHGQRFVTIATTAAILVTQNLAKLTVFGLHGFDFLPWIIFIAAMISFGAMGTWLGIHLLGKISDHHFQHYLNILLTLLACRLVWQAAKNLLY